MKKLSLNDLKVKSFRTSEIKAGALQIEQIEKTFEPTPGTRCYHCPPATIDGCF
ncbi:MAG: pinensin family lanthipeptide [Acidobacteriota bacterium]|nr:pinensin family lanthipeptide [Acidobacteriota bacterium]